MYGGVTHGITVICHHPMSCCIYTVLVSLMFGTAIPTSFWNVLLHLFHWFFSKSSYCCSGCIVDAGAIVYTNMQSTRKWRMQSMRNGVRLHGSARKALSFSYEGDPTTILLAKDCAPDWKESFYAKIKVSTFVCFEVDRLEKKMMMKKSAV